MTSSSDIEKTCTNDTSGYEFTIGVEPASDDKSEVIELARLLPRVASLAAFVNSEKCSDQDRERLRECVPGLSYLLMLCNLATLRSHAARQSGQRPDRLTIDLLTFLDHYHQPAMVTKSSRSRHR